MTRTRRVMRLANGANYAAPWPCKLFSLSRNLVVANFLIISAAFMAHPISSSSHNQVLSRSDRHSAAKSSSPYHNGFQLHATDSLNEISLNHDQDQASASRLSSSPLSAPTTTTSGNQTLAGNNPATFDEQEGISCPNGLLTFELSTGFIYKPTSGAETLSMMPSTLQLTDCLDYCLTNSSCLAINFEMGLCVLLASSAKQNQHNLYSSQFPVFTIYAEKKCLLSDSAQAKQRRRCQRAWTFERVAGYEMKTKPKRRLKLTSKELCMDACLLEREFECRSANWYRLTGECTLSDQDRHSVSQSEAGDQQIKSSLSNFYGPSNASLAGAEADAQTLVPNELAGGVGSRPASPGLAYQNYYVTASAANLIERLRLNNQLEPSSSPGAHNGQRQAQTEPRRPTYWRRQRSYAHNQRRAQPHEWPHHQQDHYVDMPANAHVDYLENNCIYEPNKLCEFRKIQNRVLKTVDSIYQDVASLDECKQKCLNAPYRCYSFDYGDTSERVCRTSHLDQASLLSVREPYLDVVGAITYELAACFNVSIQCRAKEMVAIVSSSKTFKGKIYAKSRPFSCVNDVHESLKFELSMKYHDESCDVRATSGQHQGVFSNDIVIQHHDRIVTTQDVGLSVYCQYDLGNRSVTNSVDLAIERIPDGPVESKHQQQQHANGQNAPTSGDLATSGSQSSPLTITGLATAVVKSPNVTMRITNMNGQPVTSATVGDRLALLFEIKEKTSPFGIFVREIVAMDGRQFTQQTTNLTANNNEIPKSEVYHYASGQQQPNLNESAIESVFRRNVANSIEFIDSDGCPTDANLMGPLVRMDPSGHRLLAPFDAFKFPTSDMVFFRAVVTSCLAECKPAVCPAPVSSLDIATTRQMTPVGRPSSATPFDSTLGLSSRMTTLPTTPTTTTSTASTTTTTTTSRPVTGAMPGASDAQMTSGVTGSQQVATTGSATSRQPQATTLVDGDTYARLTASVTDAPTTTTRGSGGGLASTSPGDSMTIVPGFDSNNSSSNNNNKLNGDTSLALTTTNWPVAADLQQEVNMTNNHNGRAPPRPTTASLPANLEPSKQIGTLNLATMTTDQKQQLIKLFETKIKQQFVEPANNESLADLSDLYTGFLTSVMLNSNSASETPNTNNNNLQSGEDTITMAQNYKKHQQHDQLATDLDQRTNRTNDERLMEIIRALDYSSKSLLPIEDAPSSSLTTTDVANQADYVTAPTPPRLSDQEQALPSGPIGRQRGQAAFQQQQVADKTPAWPAAAQQQERGAPARSQANEWAQKRDKASLQALADSYLGAFQSFGRRRRKRQTTDDDKLLPVASYVSMEQPQLGAAPFGAAPGGRFTHAVVEMYHTGYGQLERLARVKRDAAKGQQPAPVHDMEELVVQSIKIVDRLQFEDEQRKANQNGSPSVGKPPRMLAHNLPKGSLVTAGGSKSSLRSSSDKQPAARFGRLDTSNEHDAAHVTLATGSSLGVLGVLLVALCFIFVQISMVLVCLVDWGRRDRGRHHQQPDTPPGSSSTIDCSSSFGGGSTLSRGSMSTISSYAMLGHQNNGPQFVDYDQLDINRTLLGATTGARIKPRSSIVGRRDERLISVLREPDWVPNCVPLPPR